MNRMLKSAAMFLTVCCVLSQTATAQTYVLSSPFGYGRNATGGAGGAVKTVTTRADLDAALNASGSAVILVSGTITFGSGQMISRVVTNKTVIGLSGAKLVSNAQVADGGILELNDGSKNVIIRNLVFEGPGAYDVDGKDLLFVRGTDIWVDHCEFYDGVDGNFDISNEGDNITATWNRFGYNKPAKAGGSGGADDHRFSNLISGGDGRFPSDGRYSVTLAYNWWGNGVRERMPRARNAQLHLLNNYVNTNVSSSKAIGLSAGDKGTDVYVENCHFKSVGRVLDASYGGSPKVTIIGSDRDNGNTNGGTSKPTYSYTAIPYTSVEAAVTGACGAGAKLTVNASTGAVSCGSTPPPPPPNQNPTASITSPANNAQFAQGATITISATASDPDGSVAKVEFYNGSTKLGEDTSSPYSFAWTNPPTGTHSLTARATDNQNATGTSSAINVTVAAAPPPPPPPPAWSFIGRGAEYFDSVFVSAVDAAGAAAWSAQSNLRAASGAAYSDREHTITSVPTAMQGAEWLRGAMDLRTRTTPDTLIKFKARKAGAVYIAYENRVTAKPAWLAARGFTQVSGTTMTVTESNGTVRTFDVFRKNVAQGETVALGNNSNDGMTGTLMYLAAFTAAPSTSAINKIAPSNYAMNVVNAGSGMLRVNYIIKDRGDVRLDLFDVKGVRVKTFVNTSKTPGAYQEHISTNELSAGMYIIKLKTGGAVLQERVTVAK